MSSLPVGLRAKGSPAARAVDGARVRGRRFRVYAAGSRLGRGAVPACKCRTSKGYQSEIITQIRVKNLLFQGTFHESKMIVRERSGAKA